jgi:hypothetical protein
MDLSHGRVNIGRFRGTHALDGDGGTSTNLDLPNLHRTSGFSFYAF